MTNCSIYYEGQKADRARYLQDTRHHEMTIRHDDGLYRHITFSKPGCSVYHHHLTTFPGYLAFTGDMGSYVFSRTADMFGFHRIDFDRNVPTIDYRYWAQKCEAADKRGGICEYDSDAFEAAVKEQWRAHRKDDDFLSMSKYLQRTVSLDFKWDVLDMLASDDERESLSVILRWSYHDTDAFREIFPFQDCCEWGTFKTHTFSFRWACWAIAEGIRAYDLGGTRAQRAKRHYRDILKGRV